MTTRCNGPSPTSGKRASSCAQCSRKAPRASGGSGWLAASSALICASLSAIGGVLVVSGMDDEPLLGVGLRSPILHHPPSPSLRSGGFFSAEEPVELSAARRLVADADGDAGARGGRHAEV